MPLARARRRLARRRRSRPRPVNKACGLAISSRDSSNGRGFGGLRRRGQLMDLGNGADASAGAIEEERSLEVGLKGDLAADLGDRLAVRVGAHHGGAAGLVEGNMDEQVGADMFEARDFS